MVTAMQIAEIVIDRTVLLFVFFSVASFSGTTHCRHGKACTHSRTHTVGSRGRGLPSLPLDGRFAAQPQTSYALVDLLGKLTVSYHWDRYVF